MKKFVVVIALSFVGCSTPQYYEISLISQMDGKYHFNIKNSKYHCLKTKIDGNRYPESCSDNSNTYYKNYYYAFTRIYSRAKKMCGLKKIAVYRGFKQNKEFIGNTGSHCSGNSYSSGDTSNSNKLSIKTSSYNICTASKAIYRHSTDVYYQCSQKRDIQDVCGLDMRLCNNFGLIEYDNGDIINARKLLKKSCDGGNEYGCGSLGEIEYVEGNFTKAKKLFKKACKSGEKIYSCTFLETFKGNKENISKMIKIYEEDCRKWNGYACKILTKLKSLSLNARKISSENK